MNLKESIKNWATLDLKMTVLYTIMGAIVGYISFLINSPLRSLVIAMVVLAVSILIMKRELKIKEEKGWWTSKAIVFLFTWIIIWTIFYNINLFWA